MKTQDKVIRNRALAALVRWQDDQIVDWLEKQLGGPDVSFKSYALWALGRIGAPVSIDRIIAYAKATPDRETLWAAIPALGWLGEGAPPDKKQKIVDFLTALRNTAATIGDPAGYDGRYSALKNPDPANANKTILDQRITMSLARCGQAASMETVKKWTSSDVLRPNRDYFEETQKKLQ